MKNKRIQHIFEIICISLIFITVCYLYHGQKPMSCNQGKGVDGSYYYEGILQIKQGLTQITGTPPFINRVGYLASTAFYSKITNQDIIQSSFQFNLIGSFITVILLMLWLRHFIKQLWIRILLTSIFMFTWHVPIRHLFFNAIAPDVWGSAFFLASLLLLWKIKTNYSKDLKTNYVILIFSIFISISSLFRESNLLVGMALLFIHNPIKELNLSLSNLAPNVLISTIKKIIVYYKHPQKILLFLPIVLTIIVNQIASQFIILNNVNGYSYIKALVQWFYDKSFVEYLTAVFIAYGPIIILTPFYYSDIKKFMTDKNELFFILVTTFIIGYIAGGDTERILFMSSFPIVFIIIGLAIEKISTSPKKWWLIILLTLQTFAMRVFWNLPDYPNDIDAIPIPFFGLMGNHFQHLLLYSYHGNRNLNTLLLMEYIVLLTITAYILRKGNNIQVENH